MPVKYRVAKRAQPGKPNAPHTYHPVVVSRGETNLKQISKRISSMSTVNSADVLAVLDALVQVMQTELADGQLLRLGDFGTFSLVLGSSGERKKKDAGLHNIRTTKIYFRPGKDLKDTLKNLVFEPE